MADRNPSRIVLSKLLSLVLRHAPEALGLTLDTDGWVEVETLLKRLRAAGHDIDRPALNALVADDDKRRYAFDASGTRLRAVQGHSLPLVGAQYTASRPPDFLFHGTATRFLDTILREGLDRRQRNFVHLSETSSTAIAVGRRYGKPVVLRIDAESMLANGHLFYQAENGVWLTLKVPSQYLRVMESHEGSA